MKLFNDIIKESNEELHEYNINFDLLKEIHENRIDGALQELKSVLIDYCNGEENSYSIERVVKEFTKYMRQQTEIKKNNENIKKRLNSVY